MSRSGHNGRDDELAGGAPGEEAAAAATNADREHDAGTAGSESGLVEVVPAREDVEALRRERDELKDALLRRRAEFENYKKRVERDQRAASLDGAAEIFRRLVGSVDNLERALAARGDEAGLRQGVELTLRDLQASFEAQGVSVLDPLGQRFDPSLHQALLHEHVPGYAEGTVAEVLRKGYTYRERLLRPALVKVASGETEGGGETGDAGGGDVQ